MASAVTKKLSSQSGETLAETLVSMLVAGLSIIMLAMAISAGSRIILHTKATANNYKVSTNSLVSGTASLSGKVAIVEESGELPDASASVKAREVSGASALPGGKPALTYAPDAPAEG